MFCLSFAHKKKTPHAANGFQNYHNVKSSVFFLNPFTSKVKFTWVIYFYRWLPAIRCHGWLLNRSLSCNDNCKLVTAQRRLRYK